MSSKKEHSPQHEALLKKQALEQQEVKEVLVFFQKYAKPAATALVIVFAVILASKFIQSQNAKKEAAGDAALMNAQTIEQLQDVLDNYGSTDAAPMALMALAREQFNAGKVDEAEALYERFTQKNGDHEMAINAEFNLIACKEAKGQLGDAHLLYGKFADEHTKSFLAPAALMGQARCLESLGQLDDAKVVYENIMVNYPGSTWFQTAEANLNLLQAKMQ